MHAGYLMFAGMLSQLFAPVQGLTGPRRRAVELIRSTNAPLVQIAHVKQVIAAMQNSPTAAYLQDCSLHEKIMLASLLKCVKREGVDEIHWGNVCLVIQISWFTLKAILLRLRINISSI
jgi:hypothetical protein